MTSHTPDKKNADRLYIVLSVLAVFLFAAKSFQTAQYKQTYGSVDLRNRIVGARITAHKQNTSAYFYKWQKEDGEKYLDLYDTPGIIVNRNTVTPFVLQLLQPFCDYTFQSIAVAWYIAEILSLLLILLLLWNKINSWPNRFACIIIVLIVTGASQGWLLHNINGQLYIFYALLLTLLYHFYSSHKKLSGLICSFLLLMLFLMRPVMIVFAVPFLLQKKWKPLLYFSALLLLYFSQQYLAGEIWLWKDYIKAMNEWAVQIFQQQPVNDYINIDAVKQSEGAVAIKSSPYQVLTENSSLAGLVYRFTSVKLLPPILMMIIAAATAAIALFYRKHIFKFDARALFVLSFLLYFIMETCLPAVRNIYCSVQWVFPLLLVFYSGSITKIKAVLLTAGTVLSLGLFKFFPFDLTIAELIFAAICFNHLNTQPVNA